MIYSNIPLAQTVTSLCKQHNIEHVVISPGSRNAPLTISFTNDQAFTCYSVVDERSAAFFALGIAQQTERPVILLCTSGSAVLNYYPAISEAYYSNIPLVVLSSDRPEFLVDIGDGQTIKQKGVFGKHVHYSANLVLDLREEAYNFKMPTYHKDQFESSEAALRNYQNSIQTKNEVELNCALHTSQLNSGPVHINIPFDEPLYNTTDKRLVNPKVPQRTSDSEPSETYDLNEVAEAWQEAERKMILIGVLSPNSVEEIWLEELAKDESVVVFTETTSNIHHPEFFPGIDKMIGPLGDEEFKALQPELLITFGGMVVSKKIKAFLRGYKPKQHWHIGPFKANDTFFCLNKHLKVSPNMFLSNLLVAVPRLKSAYKPYWLKIRDKRRLAHSSYVTSIPFSDFKAFDRILESLPKHSQLQIGNSSAIRYTQLFQLRKDITVFCNRGTSGIDGSTSTAIGAAVASQLRTTLITGDLSFFYDSNALWNSRIPSSFRIIVINNGGGGIFRILPGHKNTDNFDKYFETRHDLKANELAKMFGFNYVAATTDEALKKALQSFYNLTDKPKILEVFTPARINDELLLNYFNYIK